MSRSSSIILSLALLGGASASNVTHLTTTAIAIGASTTTGADMYVPASNGESVGVIESKDGGNTLTFTDVGETLGMAIAMATAASESDKSVVVGGLFGAGYSLDSGATWQKLGGIEAATTQDVKYEPNSGLYAITGNILGKPSVAVSASASTNFTTIEVDTTLLLAPDIRYGSVPTADTLYVTAGFWATTPAEAEKAEKAGVHAVSPRLTVDKASGHVTMQAAEVARATASKAAAASRANGGWQPGDPWCQVLKSSDGGATWIMVYNDTTSGLYPNDISCWDANTCTFVKDGSGTELESVVVSTADGGKSWTEFTVPSGGGNGLMPVRMVGATEVWAAGGSSSDNGEMWHTTDLVNWDSISTTTQQAASLSAFAVLPTGKGCYATGFLLSQICSVLKIEF